MVSHELKAIFIHIPKTGGSSIEQIIWPMEKGRSEAELWMGFKDAYHNEFQTGGLQHLLAHQVRNILGDEVFSSYFKFSIVRNPWDKALSQYRYMTKRPDLMSFVGMSERDCFKRYLERIQTKEHVQWLPQYRFVMSASGDSLVDYIGRFEEFEHAVKFAVRRIGLSCDQVPHLNASDASRLEVLDRDSCEQIAEIYKDDISVFGYSISDATCVEQIQPVVNARGC
ncbi:sulfotransferase family 2 domain-containing protein [Ectopseudomonas guguanensis]|uniref:Sulfotransferase family protein n=1 Tax=Ectopseudomonas guguanensis TaxID=1198456 RepID=A0A1H0TMN0_9GAMM|nr:sulfotransferase family 2 domain-containing protein [Pseudomonas guguanensis]SDP55259.1 Sulfotransferase family protein [Pseudomonas guguanensis]